MYSHFLQPYIIYPTRIVQNAKPSLIDNIFANCIDKEILSGNLIQNITDHLPNFILLPNYQKSELMMKYKKRDYSKFNEKEYLIDLNNANVSNAILDSNDTSIKYDIFHNHLLQTLDKHTPIVYLSKREVTIKTKPWLTKGILKSIKIRTTYYKKFMNTKKHKWYDKYRIYRDKINHLLRKSKNNHYKNYFATFKRDSKKVWIGINDIISKTKKHEKNINLYENNQFISNQQQIANKFNTFFTTIGPNLSEKIDDLGKHFSTYLPPETMRSFFVTPTSANEIAIEIKLLSENTAADFPVKLLKLGCNPLSELLCHVSNHSFTTGNYPDTLKLAIVTPAHKSDSKMFMNNYRPISVLPIFSKILERLMHKRLFNFLTLNNSLFEHQFGFQPRKTTSMAILDIYTTIVQAFENNENACCVFLDFAKAFDTVNHDILLRKLENYGIRGLALNWFNSYLKNRMHLVNINSIHSNRLEIKCGVPQGSVLGPLLFLIYINDIYMTSTVLKFHLFADDTSIFYANKDIKIIEKTLNAEIKLVAQWLSANKLSLNVSKSSFIIFHPPQKKLQKVFIKINSEIIPAKNNAKYLGVVLDKHLSWTEHIHYLNTKLYKSIGMVSKLRHYVSQTLLRTIYFAFFQPHIEYCINIWTCTTRTTLEPINISMKKAIRKMTFSRMDSHTKPLFKKLNILDFQNTLDLILGKFVGRNQE